MRHGFVKVAAVTPDVRVADCDFNGDNIIKNIKECAELGVKIAVFPELSVTGYTCGELFLQDRLLRDAENTLERIIEAVKDLDILVFAGLPFERNGKLYNAAAAFKGGRLLGIVPKKNLPEYSELYEARYFAKAPDALETVKFGKNKEEVPFGTKIIFENGDMKNLKISAEICEDLWVPIPESSIHAEAGATVIVNLSASPERVRKHRHRKSVIREHSARLRAGYIYATAGNGESSTDLVFGGHNIICEGGALLAEKKCFENGKIISDIDVDRLVHERRKTNTFKTDKENEYTRVEFYFNDIYVKERNSAGGESLKLRMTKLDRKIKRNPFISEIKEEREEDLGEAIMIQAMALKKRLEHTGTKHAVIGISGGLDSTLALLVTCKAFDMSGLSRENITAVTLPCFGTTDRTHDNAIELAKELHVSFTEIDIKESVTLHLKDIGHDGKTRDVAYENAQARERTQVLMDLANKIGGMVIGTGDMSELALGWATYNGDHMSMYGLNASVPKTLVRYLVLYFAERYREEGKENLSEILFDILDTPVSPELLPPDKEGKILQKTEDIVGPYELHDFFMYYIMRWGFAPDKVYRLACTAFLGEYDEDFIYKWLKKFYERFFASQYKRSCLPDGPKVGYISLSPRGDWRMPSDACVTSWLKALEEIR